MQPSRTLVLEKAPASKSIISTLYQEATAIGDLEKSSRFVHLTNEEFESLMGYLAGQESQANWVVVTQSQTNDQDITLSKGIIPREYRPPASLESSWVMLNPSEEAEDYVRNNKQLQRIPSFFDDWPTFDVVGKMSGTVSSNCF
eukprot:TRINITY_DN4922_c0_g1_i3.p1 TRINITY_DN4922_c0_g1~~TRINITY_DN4922_c0_g1_i3.p1  ORF type:complete len:144 (+),score=25.30 TRINITY_DN4922_c0_g1_i3:160-591(+)